MYPGIACFIITFSSTLAVICLIPIINNATIDTTIPIPLIAATTVFALLLNSSCNILILSLHTFKSVYNTGCPYSFENISFLFTNNL